MARTERTRGLLARLPTGRRERLLRLAAAADGRAWLVGGLVRDLILRRPSDDVDVVVEGDAVALARRLPVRVAKSTAFGTVTIAWPGGEVWDLVTARSETYAQPAALPAVTPGTLADDLRRRDFAVNAMALGADDELIDPHDGVQDLRDRCLRILHAASFVDDPTRLFRLARYAARLEFAPDEVTERLAVEAVAAGLVDLLSGDRLRHELERSLAEPAGPAQLRWLERLGLLPTIDPALRLDERRIAGVEAALAELPVDGAARWLVWLVGLIPRDEAPAAAARLAARLNLERRRAEALTAAADLLVRPLRDDRPSAVCGRLDGVPLEALLAYAARGEANRAIVAEYLTHWRGVRPKLDGHALLAAGVAPGPRLGRLLAALRAACLDGSVQTVDDEWALVSRLTARDEECGTPG